MGSRAAKLYISVVAAAGAAILAGAIWNGLRGPWIWAFDNQGRYVFYLAIALAASAVKITLPSVTGTMSMNFLFVLIGVSQFSVPQTMIMGCLGILVQSVCATKKRPRPVQVMFNVASMACSIQATYQVNRLTGLQSTILSAGTFFVANTFLIATVIALTEEKNVWRVWHDAYFWSFPNYLVGASAAWVVTVAARVAGWQAGLLVLPIFYVVYRSHSSYLARLEEGHKRAEERRIHAEEVAALHRRTIETLALAIEAKDQTTHDHLARVETYAVEVAKDLGFSETELEALRAAALLHDVGKIAVPEYIISKPGKLTPEEFEIMKTHTVIGAELVERIRFPYSVAPLVRGHHEKWNGSGYPDGLKAEEIPVGARILAAVDTLDALASDRQYRRALPLDQAIQMILAESGKCFDPKVVDVLARRYVELEQLARSCIRMRKLSTDVKIERGDAPAAGFESSAGETGRDLERMQRTLAEAQERDRAIATLCAAISEGRDRARALAALRDGLAALIPYDALAVYRRKGAALLPELTDSASFGGFVSGEAKVGQGVTGWVVESGKTILNGNPAVESGYAINPAAFAALGSAVSVPLITAAGIAGAVSLYRCGADAFSRDDLAALNSVAAALSGVFDLAEHAV
ncbi:MAG TPA: HD domain-containing phosphohydrolase [Bryobacteraceae bacterium]|nr:HD domain-containing phosphohydrolase [Bryobacteraceae bacterium]